MKNNYLATNRCIAIVSMLKMCFKVRLNCARDMLLFPRLSLWITLFNLEKKLAQHEVQYGGKTLSFRNVVSFYHSYYNIIFPPNNASFVLNLLFWKPHLRPTTFSLTNPNNQWAIQIPLIQNSGFLAISLRKWYCYRRSSSHAQMFLETFQLFVQGFNVVRLNTHHVHWSVTVYGRQKTFEYISCQV